MTYSLSPDKITWYPLTSQDALGQNRGRLYSTFDGLSLANHALRLQGQP